MFKITSKGGPHTVNTTLSQRPCTPLPPAKRGDNGKGPLPKTAYTGESRNVKLGGKQGRA